MKEDALLCLRDVSFSYHTGRQVLTHVDLTIRAGERIAVLGPNGAGKSTLFLLINGVLRPSRGSIYYKGRRMDQKNSNELRRSVGIIFQDADSQIIAPSVREEISFGPMNLKLSSAVVEERVAHAIASVNLQGFEERPPHYLSGGEKKRVSIADIIAMKPDVFLFDEPMACLDPAHARRVETLLEDLSGQGKTLLVSTHDVDFAYRWAQRILIVQEGSLKADGTPPAVFAQEALCRDANLSCPVLLRIEKMLESRDLLRAKGRNPRTVEELELLLKQGNDCVSPAGPAQG